MSNAAEQKKLERHPYFEKIAGSLHEIENAAKGSGRTTAMIETMRDGDMLVVHTASFGQQVQQYAREKLGKNIIVITAANRQDFFRKVQMDMQGFRGNIFVDHHFLDIFTGDILREQEHLFMSLQAKYVR